MLKRLVVILVAFAAATIGFVATGAAAFAAGSGSCQGTHCWVVVTGPSVPGTQGTTGGGGGGPAPDCYVMYGTIKILLACWEDDLGAFSNSHECYYKLTSPQPDPGAAVWHGHTPAEGRIYDVSCIAAGGAIFHLTQPQQTFLAGVPADATATRPTPAEVASQALADLTVGGPEIGTAPRTDGRGLVGLPVWLWTDQNQLTWGPIPVSKTDGGITVNVEADAQYVVWDMGDGHSITCHNPGTSFSGQGTTSPTCGYRYLAPSRTQPGGVYTVTATTHWLVTWTANTGEGGTLTTDVPSTTTITIDELQVVTS